MPAVSFETHLGTKVILSEVLLYLVLFLILLRSLTSKFKLIVKQRGMKVTYEKYSPYYILNMK